MRVGLMWRTEWDSAPIVEQCKLRGVFEAFSDLGVNAEPVVYSDETVDAVRDHLLVLDGVLVWVNPIERGHDRSVLDPLLRQVSNAGVFVSAHPDVILRMGTKQVLVDTRSMGWGTDTRMYRTIDELGRRLAGRLAEVGPIVLKQRRGMGGDGVWKVEPAPGSGPDPSVVVQHASGDAGSKLLPLGEFLLVCEPYFAADGFVVEQPFQARLEEGMIRAYLTHDEVVGFTHQFPRGLMPAGPDERPTDKVFERASDARFASLRDRLDNEWIPQLQALLGLDTTDLPVIWDADFLFGQKRADGEDTYVLCEINASSAFAFPEFAMHTVARAALARIGEHRTP